MRAQLAVAEAIALVLACAYRRAAMTAVANLCARIGGSAGCSHLYSLLREMSDQVPRQSARRPDIDLGKRVIQHLTGVAAGSNA